MKIEDDGITHINVYSKGQTELGRLLSNFAHTPFVYLDHSFQSVEGFWYWKLTGDDRFKSYYGIKAKQEGKLAKKIADEPTRVELKRVYWKKLKQNPDIFDMLWNSELPFEHYYVMNGEIVPPKKYKWTADLWDEIRKEIKEDYDS